MSSTHHYIKTDAWDKWYTEPLTDFSPERLRQARAELESGYLIETDKLYAAMLREWDVLQKDVSTMAGAVANLSFKAVPATIDGEEPTPRAMELARTVNDALWRGSGSPLGEWEHSFSELVASLYHALCRGVNVHEITWQHDVDLVYPRAYLPVSPLFYRWETQPGKRDRLLLFRDGVHRSPGMGEPFPRDRFIVALNTQGPDHPMRNALFASLIGWFGAAHWGLTWLMRYCQIYGIPFVQYNIGRDEDRTRIERAIAEGNIPTSIILEPGDSAEIKATGGGTANPTAELVTMAEKHCHKLILGQTLTSDTSDGGSRAQAEVHNAVQAAEVLAVGNYIAGVLTAQLVPAIVRANYGSAEGEPMPEIRCSLPGSKASMEKINLWDGILNKLGMRVRRSDVYDDLGIAIPEEGDDTLGGPAAPAPPGLDSISAAATELPKPPARMKRPSCGQNRPKPA